MKNISNHIFTGFLLLFLVACSSTKTELGAMPEQDIIFVVDGYEQALKNYDSKKAISYLHSKLITDAYGNEANYHKIIKKAFAAIERDGGIIKTEKWDLKIDGDKASIQSRIVTEQAQQEGILKLEKSNGKWLIVKVP